MAEPKQTSPTQKLSSEMHDFACASNRLACHEISSRVPQVARAPGVNDPWPKPYIFADKTCKKLLIRTFPAKPDVHITRYTMIPN